MPYGQLRAAIRLNLGVRWQVVHLRTLLVAGIILFSTSPDAPACGVVEGMTFADHLKVDSSVVVLRVESLRLSRSELAENMTGRLRIVETLKGPPAKFRRIEVDGLCNDVRLDVGGYYLIATSQTGTVLKVDFGHSWLIDISLEYQEGMPRDRYSAPIMKTVESYLAGSPLPPDFPSAQALARGHKWSIAP